VKGALFLCLLALSGPALAEPLIVDNGRLFITARINGVQTEALLDKAKVAPSPARPSLTTQNQQASPARRRMLPMLIVLALLAALTALFLLTRSGPAAATPTVAVPPIVMKENPPLLTRRASVVTLCANATSPESSMVMS